jgi:putative 4-mercaptohistidine N1-methyltranferase
MSRNFYETDRALSEYLLFHYGMSKRLLPPGMPDCGALDFPVRCVTECLDFDRLAPHARALDLGCAVGRASFELAKHCAEVVAIDYSKQFIRAAKRLQSNGTMPFNFCEEGELTSRGQARAPRSAIRHRIQFEVGDAMALGDGLGSFDVILMANLIDRLRDPRKCLAQLPQLLKRGGQFIITSPYTWLPEYTPKQHWLGGFERGGKQIKTFDTLKSILSRNFRLHHRLDLPFLLREHARKFQFSVAEASVWLRK